MRDGCARQRAARVLAVLEDEGYEGMRGGRKRGAPAVSHHPGLSFPSGWTHSTKQRLFVLYTLSTTLILFYSSPTSFDIGAHHSRALCQIIKSSQIFHSTRQMFIPGLPKMPSAQCGMRNYGSISPDGSQYLKCRKQGPSLPRRSASGLRLSYLGVPGPVQAPSIIAKQPPIEGLAHN